ncbi:DUF2953 domain-containing protein [Sutcliffiella halmapala]|uniref:DUF2953 domain-containing protein n=1 Tax=Sutcliffiella halmapala TaxID=79882 RepID=UPI001116EB6D|nr:DUF2953 domain-containing protein [Sutcliffiella halmapala]
MKKGRESMLWIGVLVGIAILLFLLIIFTKITIHFYFHHEQDNDQMIVKLSAWFGLIRYTIDVPLIKVDKDSASIQVKEKTKMGAAGKTKEKEKDYSPKDIFQSIGDTYELVRHVVGMHEIVRRFLSKVEIKKLEWHSNVGLGDAAYTGMVVGAAWSLKGGIVGFMSQYTKMKADPVLSITPFFQQAVSQTLVKCMIRFQIGYAILAGIRTVKYWKGGRPKFKTRPLSLLSKEDRQESM